MPKVLPRPVTFSHDLLFSRYRSARRRSHHLTANLFRTTRIKFYQNRPSSIQRRYDKTY